MKLLSITKSSKPDKKLVAKFETDGGRTKSVHFGAAGMDDYTKTKDVEQRARYRQRHAKDLTTGDPSKAGYLSYYVLWGNSTSMKTNIAAYKKKFNL
jgi:hypothetical protein